MTAPVGELTLDGGAAQSDAAIRRKHPGLTSTRLRLMQIGVGVAVVALWQLAYSLRVGPPVLAVSPGEVLSFLVDGFYTGEIWNDLGATLAATVVAFVLASVIGVFIGLTLALLPTVERVLDPYLTALNSMPRIALGPLFLVYFGIGLESKVALAFSLVVFILMINTRSGVLSVDDELLRMTRVYGASRVQTFFKVLLPGSVPSIFAGLRLGLIYALLGVITMELIAAQTGLGARIVYYSAVFQIAPIVGILIILAIVASLLNLGMAFAEARLLRWRAPNTK